MFHDISQKLRSNKRLFLYIPGIIIASFCLYLLYLYFVLTPQLTRANFTTSQPIPSQIVDRNGVTLYTVGEIRRTVVGNDDLPTFLKDATISAEDKQFYSHAGIDAQGIARALVADIKAREIVQGGSTITQQLVKNTVLSRKKTLTRKVQEAVMAIILESRMTKDQIMTAYLNNIPYGNNIIGAEAAARTLFGKPAKELTLPEAATLAALPRSPSALSPYTGNKEALISRRNLIIDLMVEQKRITREEAQTAKTASLEVKPLSRTIIAPHFSMMVRDAVVKEYGEKKVYEGGLIIKTTLDSTLQADAENIVKNHRGRIKGLGANNASAVILDTKTGEVLAMVGSVDYYDESIDGQVNVTTALRQPGSSFKPYVYATLFAKEGYSPASVLYDVTTDFGGGYVPHNYDSKTRGPIPARLALAGSLNIPAVKAAGIAGIDNVINTAQALGISTMEDRDRFGLSVALGAAEVKLIEHAAGFTAFANNGQVSPAASILSVVDPSGKELYGFTPATHQAITPEVAFEISDVLSDNQARSYIFGSNSPLAFPRGQVGAKTGTSNNFKDTMTVGFSTSRTIGVWVGNTNNKPMRYGADGVVTAAPIWRQLMTRSMQGLQYENFPRPSTLQLVQGEWLAPWQLGSTRLASNRAERPQWQRGVDNYLQKKQEEEQQNQPPVTPPTEESPVGGVPDDEDSESGSGGGGNTPTPTPAPIEIPPPTTNTTTPASTTP